MTRAYVGFYDTDAWRMVRYKALKLHGGRCQLCGQLPSGVNYLHVDHIKPRSKYPKLELELSNLQVLCATCNLGKRAWDESDWRKGGGVFLIRRSGRKQKAHIWTGQDTACHMASNGGLKLSRFELSQDSKGKELCHLCVRRI